MLRLSSDSLLGGIFPRALADTFKYFRLWRKTNGTRDIQYVQRCPWPCLFSRPRLPIDTTRFDVLAALWDFKYSFSKQSQYPNVIHINAVFNCFPSQGLQLSESSSEIHHPKKLSVLFCLRLRGSRARESISTANGCKVIYHTGNRSVNALVRDCKFPFKEYSPRSLQLFPKL